MDRHAHTRTEGHSQRLSVYTPLEADKAGLLSSLIQSARERVSVKCRPVLLPVFLLREHQGDGRGEIEKGSRVAGFPFHSAQLPKAMDKHINTYTIELC